MTLMLSHAHAMPVPAGPSSPSFSEDLSRFPSESLHSFSFAHQSEDFLHNRQTVLKRSIEFMKDRMGWSVSSSQYQQAAALASAQARATGDIETQDVLELLVRSRLVGPGNLTLPDQSAAAAAAVGPLTSPPAVSDANVFDKGFMPRSASPEALPTPLVSPTASSFASRPVSTAYGGDGLAAPNLLLAVADGAGLDSESSSRTPTNESRTTAQTSPPHSRRQSLKRTLTDTLPISIQHKLMDTMAQPFVVSQGAGFPDQIVSPTAALSLASTSHFPGALGPALHGPSTRWVPAAQAIFTTEARPPWTIIAANDLACLVFGVTRAEVRKMGILEVVQEDRREWLRQKLLPDEEKRKFDEAAAKKTTTPNPAGAASGALPSPPAGSSSSSTSSSFLGRRSGITAKLLSKPNSRSASKLVDRRAQTVHSGDAAPPKTRNAHHHQPGSDKSRGVLLCGDVVPIQKRNGATGSASLWVKEKRVGLIWVLEEIHEDVATVAIDEDGCVQAVSGATGPIWGLESLAPGVDIGRLIPRIPRQGIDPRTGEVDFAQIARPQVLHLPQLGQGQHTLQGRAGARLHRAARVELPAHGRHRRRVARQPAHQERQLGRVRRPVRPGEARRHAGQGAGARL